MIVVSFSLVVLGLLIVLGAGQSAAAFYAWRERWIFWQFMCSLAGLIAFVWLAIMVFGV